MASISTLPIPARFPDPFTTDPHIPERVIGERRNFRAVWVSDIHLGTRGCNAAMLIDFFDHVDCETLYLVGDIIDGWRLKKRHFWPPEHNDVVWRVLKRAKRGTRVVYVPGNHDEMIKPFDGFDFGGVEIRREAIHETADGRKLLVVHGDDFDAVMLAHRWLAVIGDAAYTALMKCNVVVNAVRHKLGLPYWSLSNHLKLKVKNAVQYVCSFEEAVTREAVERGLDGIVCGHIHCAEIRQIGNVTYYNDGDWVESCTALVEDACGAMRIVDWTKEASGQNAAAKELETSA